VSRGDDFSFYLSNGGSVYIEKCRNEKEFMIPYVFAVIKIAYMMFTTLAI